MSLSAHIVARALSDADLAPHLDLLASYGIAGRRVDVAHACAISGEETIWLTCESACAPVLAFLSSAWAATEIGAFASLSSRKQVQAACRARGLPVSDESAARIEGLVWDGHFFLTRADEGVAPAATSATAGELCARLGVKRGYLRVDLGADGQTIVDACLVIGDATAILRAREAGVCPIWAAVCLAVGRRPLIPVAAAHDGAFAPRRERVTS